MNKISGIYGLKCKITNKWYIGVSIDIVKRWHTGYELLQCKRQIKIYRALLKYGYQNFDKIILERCDKSVFKSKETYWINKYDSVNSGYNAAPGGEGGFRPIGIPCSEETKSKISKANKGNKHSEKTKSLMSIQRKGVSKPLGFGKKISRALSGIPLTEERKKNISLSRKGQKWSTERKSNINYHAKNHPRWKPLSKDNQDFIRQYYQLKSENWIRMNIPTIISQKKLNRCINNLNKNPAMPEVIDFI